MWKKYKDRRNYTTTLIRETKIRYYDKLNIQLSDFRLGQKKWWSYVKSVFNNNCRVSIPVIREGSQIVCDAQKKAVDLFNEYFISEAKSITQIMNYQS